MDIAKKIKAAAAAADMPLYTLAEKIGTTPGALSQRMQTGKFTAAELDKIAAALGATYIAQFRFPDGTII